MKPKLKKYKVYGIDWDCFAPPSHYDLPFETEIEVEENEDVIDALSEKYCWDVNSVESIEEI